MTGRCRQESEMNLLDYQEAAQLLGVTRGTLYAWVSQKRLPFIRFSGRCVRFERDVLLKWIAKHRVAPAVSLGPVPRKLR